MTLTSAASPASTGCGRGISLGGVKPPGSGRFGASAGGGESRPWLRSFTPGSPMSSSPEHPTVRPSCGIDTGGRRQPPVAVRTPAPRGAHCPHAGAARSRSARRVPHRPHGRARHRPGPAGGGERPQDLRPAAAPRCRAARSTAVGRHGKFLDSTTARARTSSSTWPAAGWLRWKDDLPATPAPARQGPAGAAGAILDDGRRLRPHRGGDAEAAGRLRACATRRTCRASPGSAPTRSTRPSPATCFAGAARRGTPPQIKGVLRDQSVIAGIGNAY